MSEGGVLPENERPAGLTAFNALDGEAVTAFLLGCCASSAWAAGVVAARPYPSVAELVATADAVLSGLDEAELDAALAGHPRIGERSAHASSQREQAAVSVADTDVLRRIAEGNVKYEATFGHVYLVRAAGRSADELLRLLDERLHNDAATERRITRQQLGEINRLRLERLLSRNLAEAAP